MFDEGRESIPRFTINGSDTKENFKVVIRVRPPLPREVDPEYGFSSVVEISPDSTSISLLEYLGAASNDLEREQDLEENPTLANYHCFTFDHVYDPESLQSQVYENTARPAVHSTLEGYNATLIAYGQTGTGKTYTMEGFRYGVSDPQRGIVPRSIEDIFSYIESSSNADSTFMVRVSYLQIYNENISDLLKNERGPLQIREEKRKGVFVEGLSEWAVRTPSEITSLLEKGANARATASTKMNDMSSRSHAVFIIIVEQMKLEDEFKQVKMGKLNIVDLAGSERVRVTGATGKRLEESKKINQSLSALGNVISALTDTKPRTHIPYRDSKLTRLLEDSLGGNCKTTMMAMISPAHDAFSESLSTLKFANRAKNIKNAPRVNEDVDQKALLRKYENELQKLRTELDDKNRVVVDMQRLLEIEKEKKRSVDYRESMDKPLKEYLIEQEEKKKIEEKIKIMNSQLLPGGKKIEDTPQFRSALEEKQRAIRDEYEIKLQEIEKERQQIEEDKAQIDRYKQLLLRQRDIMIALTARLNERDETIIQLQEELDAYDRIQKETEEALDQKHARCEQLEHLLVRYGIHVPAEEASRVFSTKDKKLYPPSNTDSFKLDNDSVVPLQMLTADEKILELTHIITQQKQEIEELQDTQSSVSRDEIEYLRRENYDLEVKLSIILQDNDKFIKEKQSLTGLVEVNLFRPLEQMQSGLQEGSYHTAALTQDISRLFKSASIFRSVLRGEELPKENQPPDRSVSPFKPDAKTNGRTRPLTVDEMIMIKKQEMRKAREGSIMQNIKGNAGRDETTEIMGDEISRIISEQRNLEQRYANLVTLRSSLTSISNKDDFLKVSEEMKQVAQALRENTSNLSRVLKDNPNLQGNLMKIQNDRQELVSMLDELTTDLYGLNYHSFGCKIAEEMQKQDLLMSKRQIELETTQNVKQLQEEYLKESKEAEDEIQKLRDELAEARTYQAFRLKYEEKEARAREACESRQDQHELYEKEEEVKALMKKKEVEEMVHTRLDKFMKGKFEHFSKELGEWKYIHEQDSRELSEKIAQINERKDKARTKLETLNEEIEGEKQKQIEREDREREEKLMQEKEDNARKTEACRLITREFLKYKKLAGQKNKPCKKKGKKGK